MARPHQETELCGMIPEENDPEFVSQHLSAYTFMRPHAVGKRLLEIGFGDGYGSAYLAEAAKEVVGVDVAAGNIPRAGAKYPRPNLTFLPFDGSHLPFPDEAFDLAGSFQVIEHVSEPQLLPWLLEIKRVLKRDGALFLSTLNLEQARKPGKPYQKLIYHEKEFTAPELEELLKQAFPNVVMYGLHPALKHRFFRRLKRWGIFKDFPPAIDLVRRHYTGVTVKDFVAARGGIRRALDLFAVCRKPEGA